MNLERSDFSPFDQVSAWWLNVLLSFVLWKKKRISVEKIKLVIFKDHVFFPFCQKCSGWDSLYTYLAFAWKSIHFGPQFSSIQFSLSVMSDSLRPLELQHARPPCPSPTPGVYSNSCPSSRWCHPAISSSVIPFSSCPQSLPTSGSFPMSQLFSWGGRSIGVSASASVLPMNTQDWSLGGLVGSPCSPRDSQESSPTPQFKSTNSLALSFLHSPTLTSIHDLWKNHSLD